MARAIEVEFTFDLDPDHEDWPEVQSCQVLIPEDTTSTLTTFARWKL
jgi:hypothetical protein